MRKICLLLLWIPLIGFTQNTLDLNYYLPSETTYNPEIPTPKEIIGHEVGEWHVTHDKLVQYMETLAKTSDRIVLENRGKTYEGRPILLLKISDPENIANLENIRNQHLKLTDEGAHKININELPLVIYQGFSIHGNEPSGSNAALAYAYYLAAAEGPEIEARLKNTVILLDPSFNPDGLQRFAYWANTNRNQNLNPDPNDREYYEVWPGGRTNHYWFDLNRDWLPQQLPESRARLQTFHDWLPNILTDHHEMGTNSTFFFQPGEPTRVHPLAPKINQELTAEIGTYHVKALNKIGSLYYSEENYDDYYYGKGSTFPDVNGGIGILFEQASSRGHVQESDNGLLTFPFTIRNQFTTAVSTLEAAFNMQSKILSYQRGFYEDLRQEAIKSKTQVYVFGDEKDQGKTWHLADILHRHRIDFHEIQEDAVINGKKFTKGKAYAVPLNQKNPRLIKAMFETRKSFTDSLFYDISAWTFPMAFNLDYTLTSNTRLGEKVTTLPKIQGSVNQKSDYAYLFEWHEYYTPKALNKILEKEIRAKVSMRQFVNEGKKYDYGTIMIPVQNQNLSSEELYRQLTSIAKETGLNFQGVRTGFNVGPDLGSNNFETLKKQKIALIVGDGVRYNPAGEIWHLLDQRYDIVLTKLDTRNIAYTDLSSYTDIIVPTNWRGLIFDKSATEKIKNWIHDGGTLIGYQNIAHWLNDNELMKLTFKKDTLVAENVSFEQRRAFRGAQVTGGAIFEAKIDRTHPINFGYKNDYLPLFRNTNIYLEPQKNSYNNPIQYTDAPLLSGYISEENLELIKNSVPFKVKSSGKGKIILFTDNTNFRAFWFGTNKLLMNAIYFADFM